MASDQTQTSWTDTILPSGSSTSEKPQLSTRTQSGPSGLCVLSTRVEAENKETPWLDGCTSSSTTADQSNSVATTPSEAVTVSSSATTLLPVTTSQSPVITDPVSAASASEVAQTSNAGVSTATGSAAALPSKGGVPGGAVAGIAIGMLLVGALIAGAVFFFLLRRQKKRLPPVSAAYQTLHPPYDAAAALPEKGPAVAGAFATSIDDMLPQPAADDTITDAVLKIRDNIKNHVRTYYHSSPVAAAIIDQVGLHELANATGISTSVLAGTLANPSTRRDTLRLFIGYVVLSRCTGDRDPSLIPAELSRLAAFIPKRDPAQLAMYSRWKAITGALLQPRLGSNVQGSSRDEMFTRTTTDLNSVLATFLQGGSDAGQRSKNLDMILTRSANFAFLLFSQPGSFQFDFSSVQEGLVVFPGLVQTIGDQGQVLRPVRVLLEKELAA